MLPKSSAPGATFHSPTSSTARWRPGWPSAAPGSMRSFSRWGWAGVSTPSMCSSPDCAIVTSVAMDHMDFLGDTREAIGFEKAGIFRAGRPAICSGNTYEYPTNEEQVIEEEIKNVEIDGSEVSGRLFRILSGDVIKTSKIRYAKNGQDFPFGFKLDDQAHGSQKELSVHFISPSTRTRSKRSACTVQARTSCASSSNPMPGCCRICGC